MNVVSNATRPSTTMPSDTTQRACRRKIRPGRPNGGRGRRLVFEALESRQLLAADLVARFEFGNAGGGAVSSLNVGQDFELRLFIQDVRAVPRGVFQAYFDVSYPAELAAVTGPIVHGADYSAAGTVSGDTTTPGLIDEVGGRDTDQFPPTPADAEFKLFNVPMRAVAPGTLDLTLKPADSPVHIIHFFDTLMGLGMSQIDVQGNSIPINDPVAATTLAITALDANKFEGNSGFTPFTFNVTREGLLTGTTTVNWAVTGSGPNPADAADFGGTLPSGVVTFAAGQTTRTITVNVRGDTVVEPDEGFTVTLSNASGGAQIVEATASGIIRNDDVALRIEAADADKFEGNTGFTPFTFTVTREGLLTGTTTVNWAVTGSGPNPANAADFGGTLPSGVVTFAAGQTTRTITVNVRGDTEVEPDEGFTVTLSNASGGAQIVGATASGIIRNDDVALRIRAANADKSEGNSGLTPFTFTVTREGLLTGTTTVNWAVTGSGPNPANAADFGGTLPSGVVTFAAGQTTRTITVNVRGDTEVEPDEGFTVTLSNASGGAQIVGATASGVIRNDDTRLDIVATDAEKFEGDSGLTPFVFTVTRYGLTTGTTTVDWAVTGSGEHPADAADFGGTLLSGQLTFAPGQTTRTLTVNVQGDTVYEPDETFQVTLSNPVGATLGTSVAIGTILNDDPATFGVTGLTPITSGFVVDFTAPFQADLLNLYDNAAGALGPTDLTLVGDSVGPVPGSVVVRVDHRQLTFLKTGGPLEPDDYTVTLRSAANGFVDSAGNLLDGSSSGVPGGNAVLRFAVAPRPANEVTVSVPDFARGFGQAVNLPNENATGIPVTLSTGQNVAHVELDLVFDPALLQITSFVNSVPGAAASSTIIEPGRIRISVSSEAQFRSTPGAIELGRFVASVPASAPYAAKQILRIENPTVRDTGAQARPVRSDDGLHVAAFVGDANASRTYTGGDATLLQRLIVGQGSGFPAFQLTDPMLIADVNRSDTLTGGDATLLQRIIVGTPIPQAPAPPTGITPPPIVGPDPRLFIPTDLTGTPGDTVTVPVMLEVTEPDGISLAAVDLALAYDPEIFNASNFVRGAMLDGHGFSAPTVNTDIPGILRVTMSTALGPELAFGELGAIFQFDLTVHADAQEGSSRINLLQNFESTFTGLENNDIEPLTLIPAPTNADDDPVDGMLTITAPAAILSIIATDADKPEGNTGFTPFLFTVTRSGLTTDTTIVSYSVTGSGPHPADAEDFGGTLPSGSITFEPGETEKTLTINVSGDTEVEPDEQFTVTLLDASGNAQIITSTAIGTIRNDDTQVTVSVAPTSVVEDDGEPLVYTFTRVGVISEPLTVSFLVDGTADFEVDYTQTGADIFSATEGTVTFAAGSTTATVNIVPVADDVVEDDETVILILVPGDQYTVGSPGEAIGTIVDDDRPCVFIEDADPILEGDEGTRPLVFFVRLCRPMDTELSVDYATRDGSATIADGDYQPVSGTLVFRPGEPLVQTIEVLVFGDRRVEPDEDLFVDLSNLVTADPDAVVTRSTARGVILNDDTEVAIQVAPESVLEDSGEPLIFTFSREGVIGNELTVEFQVGGTATFDEDYTVSGASSFTGNAGTVTFPAGSTTVTVVVDPIADQIVEEDETVVLTLLPSVEYTVAELATATGIILNDDTDVWVTVSPEAVLEDSGEELVFTFTRIGVIDQPLTVQFSVGGDAVFNEDYLVDGAASFSDSAGSILFAAGQTTATVSVQPIPDQQVEPDETVILTLLPGADYRPVEPVSATGVILNDDTAVAIRATDAVRSEGDSGTTEFLFTVERMGVTDDEITVEYTVSGSGPHPADADDFGGTFPSGQVTFAPGETLRTITVLVTGDTDPEPHEQFTVSLTEAPDGVQIVVPTAQGTILNDDVHLAIAPADAVKFEGPAGTTTEFTFTVTRTGMTVEDLTVSYAVTGSGPNPADADDFDGELPIGVLVFPADAPFESVQTITILVSGDNELEPDEGFTVTLSEDSGVAEITTATADGLILNDDEAFSIAAEDAVKFEGHAGTTEFTFTVTREGLLTGSTTISYAVTGSGEHPADADDFGGTLPSGQVTFAPGESVQTITIPVSGDTEIEPDETFTVTLFDPPENVELTVASAEGTILNDDAVLQIEATDAVKLEGDTGTTDFLFTVTREGFTGNQVTVAYAVTGSGEHPADADDFGGAFPSGQVTFAPGETVQTLVIPVTGDTEVEPDEEFTVTLSNATGGIQIDVPTAQGTILNDDTRITIRVEPSAVLEDSGQPLRYIFERDGADTLPLTVNFAVSGTATLGTDYVQTGAATFTATAGTVLIPVGVSTATVTIQPLADNVVELDETVVLTLTSGSGYLVGEPSAAIGTILNDDSAILSIEDGTLLEPETGVQDLVMLVRMHDQQDNPATADVAIHVDWIFAHQTTDDADFAASLEKSGNLVIPAGQSHGELRFPVIADDVIEFDETFLVTLSNLRAGDPARDVQLGRASAIGTIRDDPMTGELRGYVYQDGNNNGRRDAPSERGIPGILVTLTGTTSSGHAIELVAMTDDDGAYAFVGLQAGTYEIRKRQSTAMLDGAEELGSQQGQMEDDRFFDITLAPAAKGEGYHFGERGWRPEYVTRRMFLASSQMNAESLRMRIAQIEENNGHAQLAQQIRDGSIASVVDARPANQAAVQSSSAPATNSAAVPAVNPAAQAAATEAAAGGEGEAMERVWPAANPTSHSIQPVSQSTTDFASQTKPVSTPHVAEPTGLDPVRFVADPEPSRALPSPPAVAQPATLQAPALTDASLFDWLAWETANARPASQAAEPSHAGTSNGEPLADELAIRVAHDAEPVSAEISEAELSAPERFEGLKPDTVDEFFEWNESLPDLADRLEIAQR